MAQSGSFGKNITRGISKKLKSLFHNPYSIANINWFKLKYLKHLPPNGNYTHRLNGQPVYFSSGPEFLHGIEEIFIEEVYKQTLPAEARILDCGANIGLSVIYLKRLCPTAKIIAFEPDEKNFTLLTRNINLRHMADVVLRKEAVWIEEKMISFQAEGTMGSKIDDDNNDEENTVHKVKAIRLKDFIKEPVSFLKMDIEGAEYAVLKDISDELKYITNLFIEYHGKYEQADELLEILTIVKNAGFRFYIKEATSVYKHPFNDLNTHQYDLQLNIFCFRK